MKFKSVANEEFKAVIVAHESLGIKLSVKFAETKNNEKDSSEPDVVGTRNDSSKLYLSCR